MSSSSSELETGLTRLPIKKSISKHINYFHCVIGHKTSGILNKKLFVPRYVVLDKQGQPIINRYKQETTKPALDANELNQEIIKVWTTPREKLEKLNSMTTKSLTYVKNVMKSTNNHGGCIAVTHDSGKDPSDSDPKHYGKHIHLIIATKMTAMRRHNDWRSLSDFWRRTHKDGYASSRKIPEHNLLPVLKYLQKSPREFAGSSSECLLTLWNEAKLLGKMNKQTEDELYEMEGNDDEVDSEEQEEPMDSDFDETMLKTEEDNKGKKRKAGASVDVLSDLEDDLDDNRSSKRKKDDEYGESMLKFLMKLITNYPSSTSCIELLQQLPQSSSEFGKLLSIIRKERDSQLFNVAKAKVKNVIGKEYPWKSILQLAENKKEDKDIMTPIQTVAIFNAWCKEQEISAKKLAHLMIEGFKGKLKKKCCIYMQGKPNSGKTFWTGGLLKPLDHLVGHITHEDNFPFSSCGGKQVLIGEEAGINESTIEKYKALTSGVGANVSVKNKGSVLCDPSLVLLNSNIYPWEKLTGKSKKELQVRIHLIDKLKESQVLNQVTGRANPCFLTLIDPLTDDETTDMDQWDMKGYDPVTIDGQSPLFDGDWSEVTEDVFDKKKEKKTSLISVKRPMQTIATVDQVMHHKVVQDVLFLSMKKDEVAITDVSLGDFVRTRPQDFAFDPKTKELRFVLGTNHTRQSVGTRFSLLTDDNKVYCTIIAPYVVAERKVWTHVALPMNKIFKSATFMQAVYIKRRERTLKVEDLQMTAREKLGHKIDWNHIKDKIIDIVKFIVEEYMNTQSFIPDLYAKLTTDVCIFDERARLTGPYATEFREPELMPDIVEDDTPPTGYDLEIDQVWDQDLPDESKTVIAEYSDVRNEFADYFMNTEDMWPGSFEQVATMYKDMQRGNKPDENTPIEEVRNTARILASSIHESKILARTSFLRYGVELTKKQDPSVGLKALSILKEERHGFLSKYYLIQKMANTVLKKLNLYIAETFSMLY
jgi:hypothetical protein